MTQSQAYARIPADAQWSCCFGYPGDAPFDEIYHAADGRRWMISKRWPDAWSVTELAPLERA